MEDDERGVDLLERNKQLFEVCAKLHLSIPVGSKEFGVNDKRKYLVDIFLEVLDGTGKFTNESSVDEGQICEEIVTDYCMLLDLKLLDDIGEFFLLEE